LKRAKNFIKNHKNNNWLILIVISKVEEQHETIEAMHKHKLCTKMHLWIQFSADSKKLQKN